MDTKQKIEALQDDWIALHKRAYKKIDYIDDPVAKSAAATSTCIECMKVVLTLERNPEYNPLLVYTAPVPVPPKMEFKGVAVDSPNTLSSAPKPQAPLPQPPQATAPDPPNNPTAPTPPANSVPPSDPPRSRATYDQVKRLRLDSAINIELVKAFMKEKGCPRYEELTIAQADELLKKLRA